MHAIHNFDGCMSYDVICQCLARVTFAGNVWAHNNSSTSAPPLGQPVPLAYLDCSSSNTNLFFKRSSLFFSSPVNNKICSASLIEQQLACPREFVITLVLFSPAIFYGTRCVEEIATINKQYPAEPFKFLEPRCANTYNLTKASMLSYV